MRGRTQLAILTVLASSVLSAPGVSMSHFPYGFIQNSCAPWDGPAIEITLTSESEQCKRTNGPYLKIGVWRGLPIHAGQKVKFGPSSQAGFASRCSQRDNCERAESGTIIFDEYQDRSGGQGRYELHFKDDKTETGTFDVKWCENHFMCG